MIIIILGTKTGKQIEFELWEHLCSKWILLSTVLFSYNNVKILPSL